MHYPEVSSSSAFLRAEERRAVRCVLAWWVNLAAHSCLPLMELHPELPMDNYSASVKYTEVSEPYMHMNNSFYFLSFSLQNFLVWLSLSQFLWGVKALLLVRKEMACFWKGEVLFLKALAFLLLSPALVWLHSKTVQLAELLRLLFNFYFFFFVDSSAISASWIGLLCKRVTAKTSVR